ncbi:MAG: ABC transporter ATP-binding protein [Coriobacteriaceae bacterium]|nr:ABC transporter ATP-binding protein [Coriobacteriaceae bacterium]
MIRVGNAGYLYKGSDVHALEDISLVIQPGERVCVLGPNASGKSTLAQLIAGVRFATAGEISVDGTVLSPKTAISVARNVGFVAQDPRSSMVSSLVFDEVAFGLRNLGLPPKKVSGRALAALEHCGIRKLQHSSTTEVSGGQQQLVSLAAALALDPAYLVLDEATAMLDGTSAKRIDALVDDLVADGVGVLEITHSLLRAMGAHFIVIIDRGRIVWEGGFDALLSDDAALGILGLTGDHTVALLRSVRAEGFSFAPGCTPDDVRAYADMHHLGYRLRSVVAPHRIAPGDAPVHELVLEDAAVVYGRNTAFSELSLAIGDELVVVAGPSGSGKSTCAAVLAGVLPPDEGTATLDGERVQAGRVGLALQYPQDQLFAPTVREDIAFGPRNLGVEGTALDATVSAAADAMGIADLLDRNPFELSGGQARRAALAGILALKPAAYIFDEPLAGLDAFGRRQIKAFVAQLRAAHLPVVIVSHDVEEWLDAASRVVFLREGHLAYDCDGLAAQTRTQPYISCGLEPPLAVAVRALSGMGSERRPQRG